MMLFFFVWGIFARSSVWLDWQNCFVILSFTSSWLVDFGVKSGKKYSMCHAVCSLTFEIWEIRKNFFFILTSLICSCYVSMFLIRLGFHDG